MLPSFLQATGSLIQSGGQLAINSDGNLKIEGSALDAAEKLKLQVTGDLELLAAKNSTVISSSDQNGRYSLSFYKNEVRNLLSSLSAGEGAEITIGGNLKANVGTTDANGQLQADVMTANGVEKGESRQQINVSGGDYSRILGSLSSLGIRAGAQDSFAGSEALNGQAALEQMLQQGLLKIRQQPAIQSLIQADGSTRAYQDDAGNLKLTVAGQATVEAVFNQLMLDESYVKHPNQDTAAAVTLVAAIALTVCTGGAGAGTLGATLTTAGSASAAAINAAVIGLAARWPGNWRQEPALTMPFRRG